MALKYLLGCCLLGALPMVAHGATFDLSSGLVAYYEFESSANDLTANGNNGEVAGDVTYVSGKNGLAAKFGGSNIPGYIHIPTSASLTFNEAFSVTGWVKLDSTDMLQSNTIIGKNSKSMFAIELFNIPGGYVASTMCNKGSGTPDRCINAPIYDYAPGQWVHLAYVMTTGYATLYINGNEADTVIAPSDFDLMNNEDLYIGSIVNSLLPLKGAIDSLRIYNRALNESEISVLAGNSVVTDGCTYTVSTPPAFKATGGKGTITVKTTAACEWNATTGADWITPNIANTVKGSGSFKFVVPAYAGTASRSTTVSVAGKNIPVTQTGSAVLTVTPNAGMQSTIFMYTITAEPSRDYTLYRKRGAEIITDNITTDGTGTYTFSWLTSDASLPGHYTCWLEDTATSAKSASVGVDVKASPKVYVQMDTLQLHGTGSKISPAFRTEASVLTDETLADLYVGFNLPNDTFAYYFGEKNLSLDKKPLFQGYKVKDIKNWLKYSKLSFTTTEAAEDGPYAFWCFVVNTATGEIIDEATSTVTYYKSDVPQYLPASLIKSADGLIGFPLYSGKQPGLSAPSTLQPPKASTGIEAPIEAYSKAAGGWVEVGKSTADVFASTFLGPKGYNIYSDLKKVHSGYSKFIDYYQKISEYIDIYSNDGDMADTYAILYTMEWIYGSVGNPTGVELTDRLRTLMKLLKQHTNEIGCDGSATMHVKASRPLWRFWGASGDVDIEVYKLGDLSCTAGDYSSKSYTSLSEDDVANQTPVKKTITINKGSEWMIQGQLDGMSYGIYKVIATKKSDGSKMYQVFPFYKNGDTLTFDY